MSETVPLLAADKAMTIAADTCIYTNHNFTHLTLKSEANGSSDMD